MVNDFDTQHHAEGDVDLIYSAYQVSLVKWLMSQHKLFSDNGEFI